MGTAREDCLAAARHHLVTRGAAHFDLAAVADRCGSDVAVLEALWPDAGTLAMEVWQTCLAWRAFADTGTLAGDLTAFAATIGNRVANEEDRAVFFTALPRDGIKSLTKHRARFWTMQFDTAEVILTRAWKRHEISPGVDTGEAIRMLGTALCFDPLYKDQALRPDYVAAVIDMFVRGVARRSSDTFGAFTEEPFHRVEQSLFGADHSAPVEDYFSASFGEIRQAILDHAVEEHLHQGTDLFAVDSVARRAGVTNATVERLFRQRRDLIVEAALDTTRKIIPARDTGSLAGDLADFGINKAAAVQSEKGRTYLNTLLPSGHSADIEALRGMWRTRFNEVGQLFRRAGDRGKLRAGVDDEHAIRMIACALYYDVFFTGEAVRPEFAIQALEIFLNGVET